MKGDFSRLTFNPKKHYHSVRMQQGRVQLDADWNEQVDILNHYLETQLKDVLGPSGAPQATAGFKIRMVEDVDDTARKPEHKDAKDDQHGEAPFDFHISRGRYYVDGVLCENEQDTFFSAQPDYPCAQTLSNLRGHCIVYLDAWQRHVTAFEDPSLREIALGGIDTTTRTQNVWQVKLLPVSSHHIPADNSQVSYENIIALPQWQEIVNRHKHKGLLSARRIPHSSTLDNQLYRVEIHQVDEKEVTFKWSRENGSVVFDIDSISSYEKSDDSTAECVVTLGDLGRDTMQLQKGDWVEFVDDAIVLHNRTLPLYQVVRVPDVTHRRVTLAGRYSETLEAFAQNMPKNLLLRRWDHNPANPASQESGTIAVQEDAWLDLEHGIQVRFSDDGTYEVGDYWLIPARTLPNDIEWPSDKNGPLALSPRGSNHHHCPLALLHFHKHTWQVAKDLRQLFAPLPTITARVKKPRVAETEITEIVEEVIERNVLYEECTSEEKLAVGDLVSLVPGKNLQVTKANRKNAKLVFGVVSGGHEVAGEKRFRVTIYGRARCKITGSVEAGDLLTASEENGCATKTGPAHEFFNPGSVIGKALDSYTPEEIDTSEDVLAPEAANIREEAPAPGMIDIMVTLQ